MTKEEHRFNEQTFWGIFATLPPNTTTSLYNLAELYKDQGKYAEAEPLYKRALVIDEQVSGPEHSDVAADLNNLAELACRCIPDEKVRRAIELRLSLR